MKKKQKIIFKIVIFAFCLLYISCGIHSNKYYEIYKNEQRCAETEELVFFGDYEVVKNKQENISSIYHEITQMFGHRAKTLKRNNNKLAIYIVDSSKYLNIYSEKNPHACYEPNIGLILPYSKIVLIKDSTVRHEMIHSVTTGSFDFSCKNVPLWFKEGIAQLFQQNRDYIAELKLKDFVQIINTDFITEEKWENDIALKYIQSAAFVQFLIEQYSFDSIVSIFYTKDDFSYLLEEITHESFESIINRFISKLKATQV